jgi:hypothetical protein
MNQPFDPLLATASYAAQSAEQPITEIDSLSETLRSRQLISVMDDEVNIRQTLKLTLESYNYNVVTACDGVDAIAVYAMHQIACSGVVASNNLLAMAGVKAFLPKPFTTENLLITLYQVLKHSH